MSIKFEFLPHDGEAILVTVEDENGFKNITLIDGGYHNPFGDEYEGEIPNIDNIIVTHVDNDHIQGVIEFLQYPENTRNIKKIIFNEPKSSNLFSIISNGYTTSYKQGSKLINVIGSSNIEEYYNDVCCTHNNIIKINKEITLKIISPTDQTLLELHDKWNANEFKRNHSGYTTSFTTTSISTSIKNYSIDELADISSKPDNSLPNKSSLAFILEYKQYRFLLLGDAHIDQVTRQLQYLQETEQYPLFFDFIKLSHHGSKYNISKEFLSKIKTNNFIICQSRENQRSLPDRESIAKIAKYGQTINSGTHKAIYHTKSITNNLKFSQEEMSLYNFMILMENKFYFR